MAANFLNPYGYDPKRGGGGSAIELGDINPNKAKKEAQLFFGRKERRESSVWTAPSGNATAFQRTNVSGDWAVHDSESLRGIKLRGAVRSEEVGSIEVEIDGTTGTLTEKTNVSVPYNVTFQGSVSEYYVVLYLETNGQGVDFTELRKVRLTLSGNGFQGHFELKRILLTSGHSVAVEPTDDAGLYVSRDTRTSSEKNDFVLDRTNTARVVYLDDQKELERLTGYFSESENRFRMKEEIAAGVRLILFRRRDRAHLVYGEYGFAGYKYENSALKDETLKTVPTGNLRYYIRNAEGVRYLSNDIPLTINQSNNWSGYSQESVGGFIVNCGVGFDVSLYIDGQPKLPEGYEIGIYSLSLGGQAVSDDPDLFLGTALSLGNGEFYLESTVFPNRESAVVMSGFLSSAPQMFGENFDMPILYYDSDRNLWKINPAMGIESRYITAAEYDALAARVAALEAK